MELNDIKELMAQFDTSSLTEFSYKNGSDDLVFSKNKHDLSSNTRVVDIVEDTPQVAAALQSKVENATKSEVVEKTQSTEVAEGELVESPLVGVAYLAPSPEKPAFVTVGDRVSKGQTLMIVEAMKVMNEIPAPKDGIITEVLVANEEMVEFGKGLVRIK